MSKLTILGAGDHCREILGSVRMAESENKFDKVFFVDRDDSEKVGTVIDGAEVISESEALKSSDGDYICGMGTPLGRKAVLDRFDDGSRHFINILHPSVIVCPDVLLGRGVFASAGAVLNLACDLQDHCVINSKVCVGHDSIIGPMAMISPGCTLAGRTSVGEGAFLGAGVVTFPTSKIGEWSQVSGNATVSKKVKKRTQFLPYIKVHQLAIPEPE
jgi:sugar O-acyltransferase (sialic acid O-acetyltransferase NeuD family)